MSTGAGEHQAKDLSAIEELVGATMVSTTKAVAKGIAKRMEKNQIAQLTSFTLQIRKCGQPY